MRFIRELSDNSINESRFGTGSKISGREILADLLVPTPLDQTEVPGEFCERLNEDFFAGSCRSSPRRPAQPSFRSQSRFPIEVSAAFIYGIMAIIKEERKAAFARSGSL